MKFPGIFKYNKYANHKSARPEPAPTPAPRRSGPTAQPPPYAFERPVTTSSPPPYSNTVEPHRETTRVELKVDVGTGNLPANRNSHRWSDRITLGTEIILIHKGYTFGDVHRHMEGLFGEAIAATVKGPRDARYFVYWEPVYRQKPHRLAITHGNWNLVLELLFTKGAHLGPDFARKCWVEVHVSTAVEEGVL